MGRGGALLGALRGVFVAALQGATLAPCSQGDLAFGSAAWLRSGPAIFASMRVLLSLLLFISAVCCADRTSQPLAVVEAPGRGPAPVPAPVARENPATAVPVVAMAGVFEPEPGPDCAGVRQQVGAELHLAELAKGFERPLQLVQLPGQDRFLVIEQGGRVLHFSSRGGAGPGALFLDLSEEVVAEGEQGLLNLVFHPRFATNQRVFVYSTPGPGDVLLSEYRVVGSGAQLRVDPASERVLLRLEQRFSNHYGGQLLFGPDGYLFVGIGDGGSEGDPDNNAQRLDSLMGKILRIDVDSSSAELQYGIPADNPFVGREGVRAEIWALGLRNPWRFSIDRVSGRMWIADVGARSWEELSLGVAGGNYGWRKLEGRRCFEEDCNPLRAGLVPPVWTYGRDRGMSVIGGHVYRGCALPDLYGLYLFSDYAPPDSPLWSLHLEGGLARPGAVNLEQTGAVISSFGEGPDGELYVLDHLAGRVLRLEAKPE